mmetsp:Transcript_15443/g.50511  ORF Transcript_15443/g.50511 Transcript_15443/m.50511 type:complete len:272 (+) Transcript_15443:1992-2807(+)
MPGRMTETSSQSTTPSLRPSTRGTPTSNPVNVWTQQAARESAVGSYLSKSFRARPRSSGHSKGGAKFLSSSSSSSAKADRDDVGDGSFFLSWVRPRFLQPRSSSSRAANCSGVGVTTATSFAAAVLSAGGAALSLRRAAPFSTVMIGEAPRRGCSSSSRRGDHDSGRRRRARPSSDLRSSGRVWLLGSPSSSPRALQRRRAETQVGSSAETQVGSSERMRTHSRRWTRGTKNQSSSSSSLRPSRSDSSSFSKAPGVVSGVWLCFFASPTKA